MKWIKWIIGVGLICGATQAFAEEGNSCSKNNSCSSCCSDFDVSIYGDFLYWKVCRSDLDVDTTPDKYINPDYDSGFRLGGRIGIGCWDVDLRLTHFGTEDGLYINHHRNYDIDADIVDLTIGYTFWLDSIDANFRLFAGGKLTWITEGLVGNSSSSDWEREDFDGKGLLMGVESKWLICCQELCDAQLPISFVFRGAASILDGEFEVNDDSNNRDPECLWVPVFELFAGLQFDYCMDGCPDGISLTVGYEAQYWASWRELGTDDDVGSLGFGGAVVRLAVHF